ncbi:MAG: vacuolar family H+-ATPase subunit H [Eubacteriales bacterium]|nr:vacuolar family H+-ATPase subunit H [Eubacteriales bacterium]
MSSRIEQLIDEIEEYIDNCKYQPLSNTKIIVNKEEIDELLRELRQKTPDEIKRYQKIISNKEAILNDAREKAQTLINEATEHTSELINEHEIMQQAYAQANEVVQLATRQAQEIVDNATMEANAIRDSIMQYTDQMLASVEDILTHAVEVSNAHYGNLAHDLNSLNEVVQSNRAEFQAQNAVAESEPDGKAGGEELNVL